MNKCVLAFSGGLDTTAILLWLKEERKFDVYPVIVDLGQEEDYDKISKLALELTGNQLRIIDAKEEFVSNYVFQALKANAKYEGRYLLGTALSRPLIAKAIGEYAVSIGSKFFVHGATGRGNDQVRFEYTIARLFPSLKSIAPWREWGSRTRTELVQYCLNYGVEFEVKTKPYSIDANVFHTSIEGEDLESLSNKTPKEIWSNETTLHSSEDISIEFEGGIPTSLNDMKLGPYELLSALNVIGSKYGIGRIDIVENRLLGLKSRGCYETPGGEILYFAHREIESLCLDIGAQHLKDRLEPEYSQILYKAGWHTPEREMLQAAINVSQAFVSGRIALNISQNGIKIISRDSRYSLYSESLSSFDDLTYDHQDASGYINVGTIRLKALRDQQV